MPFPIKDNDVLINHHKPPNTFPPWLVPSEIETFHRSLPSHNVTPLVTLPSLATKLNLHSILLKDESSRFGLPAFKILGASWAVHRAVCARLNLPPSTSLSSARFAADGTSIALVTCTDGNWGRAVARMAFYLGLTARIYVPDTMNEHTQAKIRSEGAEVLPANGDYDASIAMATEDARRTGALQVMDTAWSGYEEIPGWVVEGYSTLLRETDAQVAEVLGAEARVDLAIASVGVGSFAQAVVAHYRGKSAEGGDDGTRVVAVEPVTAACLRRSLEKGHITPIETGKTIMDGMNCGTVSTLAWPVLRDGLEAAVVVTDEEAHIAVTELAKEGVGSGPCGAATLAALTKLVRDGSLGLGIESKVVLFCTEGTRGYELSD